MNLELLFMGKTQETYLREGIRTYQTRLPHYVNFKCTELSDIKNSAVLSEAQIKEKEGLLILKNVLPSDYLILFDEKGTSQSTVQMASQLEQHQIRGTKKLVFAVGGPYGFSPQVYQRAQEKWSLSPLTFSHQMVRLLCIEQLYRCFTVIKGEPYHHV